MAPSMTDSEQKKNGSQKSLVLWKKTIAFGSQLVGCIDGIIELIKNNRVLAATIAGSLLVPAATYSTVSTQVSEGFQDLAGFQELTSNQQQILTHFLNETSELLNRGELGSSTNKTDENDRKRLRANSLTALRNLDGRGKGRLLRFLAENQLIDANQPEVSLTGADLREVDLQDAWLPDINLQRTYILKGNLKTTNLVRANLREAVLVNTDLASAKLKGANLTSADLTDVNLESAELTDANLTGVNLTGADLTGANLTDANLTRTNLTGATLDVATAVQKGANFCGATMPDGQLSTTPCP